MEIKSFVFNDFAENTYVVYDRTGHCIIIDPGCSNPNEQKELSDFITEKELIPIHLVNTHCHIDHILGNKYCATKYGLTLVAHKGEKVVLDSASQVSMMYHIPYEPSPDIEIFVDEQDQIQFGETTLHILYTPGHSPASICLWNKDTQQVIAGDVLFQGSIGRTDLPGGNYETLIRSIRSKLLTLPDVTEIYPGHGPKTNIGFERRNNPFLQ
jgi:glyoxylase-like metal-dependent hydrolase (beta-lactamase superfamily II)